MDYRATPAELQPDRSILVVGTGGHVYGIDRVSGEKRWHNELKKGGFGEVTLAIGYGVVVASAGGAMLFCLDYLTGAERWHQPTQGRSRATILIEPDQILCAKGGYIECFSPEGQRLWSQPLEGAGVGRLALGYPGNVMQADDIGRE